MLRNAIVLNPGSIRDILHYTVLSTAMYQQRADAVENAIYYYIGMDITMDLIHSYQTGVLWMLVLSFLHHLSKILPVFDKFRRHNKVCVSS